MKKILITITAGLISTMAHSASVDTLVDSSQSWNGTTLPSISTKNTQVKILRITIKAGEKLPMHKHPVVNAGYLIKGQLTVITEKGKVLEMKAGDQIVEIVNQWHYGENKGTTDAEIVVVYVGEKGQPVTIKK